MIQSIHPASSVYPQSRVEDKRGYPHYTRGGKERFPGIIENEQPLPYNGCEDLYSPRTRETTMPHSHRRQFLQQSAALVTACAGGLLPARADADQDLPIIDTHQHLWDLKKFRLPWIKPGSPLGKDFLLTFMPRLPKGYPSCRRYTWKWTSIRASNWKRPLM